MTNPIQNGIPYVSKEQEEDAATTAASSTANVSRNTSDVLDSRSVDSAEALGKPSFKKAFKAMKGFFQRKRQEFSSVREASPADVASEIQQRPNLSVPTYSAQSSEQKIIQTAKDGKIGKSFAKGNYLEKALLLALAKQVSIYQRGTENSEESIQNESEKQKIRDEAFADIQKRVGDMQKGQKALNWTGLGMGLLTGVFTVGAGIAAVATGGAALGAIIGGLGGIGAFASGATQVVNSWMRHVINKDQGKATDLKNQNELSANSIRSWLQEMELNDSSIVATCAKQATVLRNEPHFFRE